MASRMAVGFLASLLAVASGGCSKLAKVEGIVTYEGQALDGATIIFLPDGKTDGGDPLRLASAFSDKEGYFRLETVNDRGILPGKYRVTVSKKVLPPGVQLPIDEEGMTLFHLMTEVIPERYTEHSTTPLRVEVPKGGAKDLRLSLNKKGT